MVQIRNVQVSLLLIIITDITSSAQKCVGTVIAVRLNFCLCVTIVIQMHPLNFYLTLQLVH